MRFFFVTTLAFILFRGIAWSQSSPDDADPFETQYQRILDNLNGVDPVKGEEELYALVVKQVHWPLSKSSVWREERDVAQAVAATTYRALMTPGTITSGKHLFHYVRVAMREKMGRLIRKREQKASAESAYIQSHRDPKQGMGFAIDMEIQDHLNSVMDVLNESQRTVIVKSFWNDSSYEEIGASMNVTRQRVLQIKNQALLLMRRRLHTLDCDLALSSYPRLRY